MHNFLKINDIYYCNISRKLLAINELHGNVCTVNGGGATARKKEKQKPTMEADLEKAVIRDCETGEELPLSSLRKEYENLKNAGETEAANFEDYLENITDKNGSCEWL